LPEHTVEKQQTDIAVTWGSEVAASATETPAASAKAEPTAEAATKPQVAVKTDASAEVAAQPEVVNRAPSAVAVEAIDFESKDGRSYISVSLSGPGETTGPIMEGSLVRFEVKNATISRALRRTIDASAFPTAVTSVTPYTVTEEGAQNVRFAVELKGAVAYALEQEGSLVRLVVDDGAFAEAAPPEVSVVEVPVPEKPAPEKIEQTSDTTVAGGPAVVDDVARTDEPRYTGQKISLVFDSADIRSILQLIGDVSGLNILASDDVKGEITLRLIDVPWDQALALILETSDLGKIEQGNVVRIMPKDKIREMEQADLQAQKIEIEEAPLESRVFKISYSSVDDIKAVITDLLSERGNIIADARNKQMIVKDVPTVLDEMADLITQIDQPEKQVMIEARIVEANVNFARDLGVKWGFNYSNDAIGVGPTGLDSAALGLGGSFVLPTPAAGGVGVAGVAAGLAFGTLGVDTITMDLRLSALESVGEGKIVSTPRVTTLNGVTATISQGTKIPYTSIGEEGAETEFEDAKLELKVTPEINPDGSVILQIVATNNAVGAIVPTITGTAMSIDEKKAETTVLVKDGETTVIGGIFVEDDRGADSGVPLLKDIPLLGHLFKSTLHSNDRRELLIFITPRILQ
jgi:type IV pilus assembly protein PilQ